MPVASSSHAVTGSDRAAEVLGRHDVRRVDGPEVGELDALLLEVDRAVAPVGHDDIAALPGDLVIGMNARPRVDALDRQALAGGHAAAPVLASPCLLASACALAVPGGRAACRLR